jgi:hypothetical protein
MVVERAFLPLAPVFAVERSARRRFRPARLLPAWLSMTLFLLIFAVSLFVIGGVVLILLFSRTPRYRTEPEQMLELFDKALANQVGETEWNIVVNYPIRHDDYLDGVRRRAQRLMQEHGRPWQVIQGKPLLDKAGREELTALRNHLASHQRLRECQRNQP